MSFAFVALFCNILYCLQDYNGKVINETQKIYLIKNGASACYLPNMGLPSLFEPTSTSKCVSMYRFSYFFVDASEVAYILK